MTQPLAALIKHLNPTEELSFELIERLSVDNKFFIHKYEPTSLELALLEVSVDELKTTYEAYDQVIEEAQGHNASYFETQPESTNFTGRLNKFMFEELTKLQPHSMLHFDGARDTYDVYVVSKQ